ncbi:MAG TPA: glucose 1-dehydrogenase [Phycisphaerae bacterium]|nr:glucose 1-dehydrogenase [Phycisphaerae bacterium]HOJ73212.1 glucose 1-dehydrogenase [Phycisphaerae bacterium]HOM51222.1 glucose 1-dehydrogenase [Phycisphaerae bacterium]HOQ88276.1 glucose 1-dehydrogenase [Phycisphaerae bacterium]HPP25350.1 glucose 1-dehydrogenase [Phycisphaerae bacterium]
MLHEFSLDGRTALVTGGSKGLGYAMARALARAGADVAIASRHVEELKAAAERLAAETKRRCEPIVCDVTRGDEVDGMVAEAIRRLRHIDVLVNNAGINIRNVTFDQTEEEFRRILDVNLVGLFLVGRAVGRHMVERGSGSVINLASMLGLVGLAGRPGYTASKGAVIQLTRTMALEWASRGVRVNALCPGPFLTEINTPVLNNPEANRFFIERIPLGRWGQPDELAGAVVFLASDASSFMTGASLVIDGGWTAQ